MTSMTSGYEVERKFRVPSFEPVKAELRQRGVRLEAPVTQVDQYFEHPARNLAETDEAFRIRSVGDANWITYKGPKVDAATKTRRELELPLPEGRDYAGQFTELLVALGFFLVAEVRKQRRTAKLQRGQFTVELAVDEVDQVGRFVELEIGAGAASLDAARDCLQLLARELQLEEDERRSYLELLLQRKQAHSPK